MNPFFITGIGTGVGKTLAAAIVAEALGAYYWKPVQAGFDEGTDAQWVGARLSNSERVLPEAYMLKLPASPHIAAREEGMLIRVEDIAAQLPAVRPLVVEGAGGLLVPLNDREFMADLALRLDATVILVSRNYLGSINHSLLTAEVCRMRGVKVAGWIFNDQYGHYEQEIAEWSGLPVLGSVPFAPSPDREFVRAQAARLRPNLMYLYERHPGAVETDEF
ncbi:dethiobiotin synthase [Puia dinghuensis]|uniref:ATP-dependent dethiobiotin synthetase BioD n=1 Tax=Puia dinghuensis TaxID=1792502 RepID=A0A8J2U6V8_9BACT|nr:dethiobiotin synthase [Puia dinghuensis]GGA82640.1 ATP-dependent dethiobiotin synthetase BioD [Puia dinghuensis]